MQLSSFQEATLWLSSQTHCGKREKRQTKISMYLNANTLIIIVAFINTPYILFYFWLCSVRVSARPRLELNVLILLAMEKFQLNPPEMMMMR